MLNPRDFQAIYNEVERLLKTGKTVRQAINMIKALSDGDGAGDKSRSTDYDDFIKYFTSAYPNTRKDFFRGVVYTKDIDISGDWTPIDNHLKTIESSCHENNLNCNYTSRHLSAWCESLKPELLIDIPTWDGSDHIKNALDRITVSNIEHDYFVELMKEWFSNIVRRMHDPKHQNRFVIFQGNQGIGKDYSINALVSGFGRYANEIDIEQQSKTEIYRVIKNLAVAVIPEFDETAKSPISVIKSIVTAKSVEMRDLYKNESTSRYMKCSFISASNFEDILRDSSGNRRFIVFKIDHMHHTFETVDGAQIAAQAFGLASSAYVASPDAQASMAAIINSMTPVGSDELFIEEVDQYLKVLVGNYSNSKMAIYRGDVDSKFLSKVPDKIRWYMIANDVAKIGRKYNFAAKTCMSVMNRAGFTHRDNKTTYYLPITASTLEN